MSDRSASPDIEIFIPPATPPPPEPEVDEAPLVPASAKVATAPLPQAVAYTPPWMNPSPNGWSAPLPGTPWTPWTPLSGYNTPVYGNPWTPPSPPMWTPSQPTLSIHRHLCYNIVNPNIPPEILWDIIHPPNQARVADPRHSRMWKKPDFDSEAIQPSVKKVWIVCDHPVLGFWIKKWGHITVASEKNVTIRDILDGIFAYLRKPLTEDDIEELNTVPGNLDSLDYARTKRAKESLEVDSVVLSSAYRRVDVVGTHRRFAGIRIVVYPDDTWRLHFNLLPGPVPRVV